MLLRKLRPTRSLIPTLVLTSLLWSCCPEGEGGFNLGEAALVVVTPDPISFSTVNLGESATILVTIQNGVEASGTLDITSVYLAQATGDFTITQPESSVLEPGAFTTLSVIYAPSDELVDSGQLVIEYHGASEPRIVPITTVEQVGTLAVIPNPISFGQVNGGTPKTVSAKVLNNGSKSVEMGNAVLTLDTSPDILLLGAYDWDANGDCQGHTDVSAVAWPRNVGIGEGFCVDVKYQPFGGGTDKGELQLLPPFVPGAPKPDPLAKATIIGVEVGPEITIFPEAKIDFSQVEMNASKTVVLTVVNEGSDVLIIDGVTKGEQQQDAFVDVVIETDVPAGTEIQPGGEDGVQISVTFTPTVAYPVSYNPLGFIEIVSNDFDEQTSFVTVFGQVASPVLSVNPPDLVDFGVVAEGKSNPRTFTLTNAGSVALTIDTLEITQNSTNNEFTVLNMPQLPLTIEDGSYFSLQLEFENTGGPVNEEVWGELSFSSNDPNAATSVQLRALRTDIAKCEIQLNPVTVNYGTVPYTKEKVVQINMVNVGSAPCSWSHATVHDGFGGFPELGIPASCSAGPVSNSNTFEIADPKPPAVKDLIKPGGSWPLFVRFKPEGNIFSELSELFGFHGMVQVHLLDYATGDAVDVVSPQPSDPVAGTYACNLTGSSGTANLTAIPGEVDFGVTTVGCHSQTFDISLYNTGKAPVSVCDIKLEGCSPEFKLKNVPPIGACAEGAVDGGLVITQSTPQKIEVVYAPQDTSEDFCQLAIYENSDVPTVTIPLFGSGTHDDEQTDIFTQLSGQEVDVLFVVDNSGSMSDEQNNLSSNFGYFSSAASQWNTDFQIAVVTTDMDGGNANAGKFMGTPQRFVTSGNGDTGDFAQQVKVGDNGSGTEQGLAAAQSALSAPLATLMKPIQECVNDDECPGTAECIPSVLDAGKNYCGGYNMEFLREDATLEIVFVSDEQDGSSAALNFYIDFFKSIKGFANENLFHAHAIVGPNGGCDGAGGSADDGSRYREVALQTGGKIHSICDTNWAQKLEDIGTIAFGLKVQFFLSRPAIPGTVTVKVGGQECLSGWTHQEETNSVLFDENGGCMPQENEQIEIYYEVICYSN